jgi:hypothetical protein
VAWRTNIPTAGLHAVSFRQSAECRAYRARANFVTFGIIDEGAVSLRTQHIVQLALRARRSAQLPPSELQIWSHFDFSWHRALKRNRTLFIGGALLFGSGGFRQTRQLGVQGPATQFTKFGI